MNQKRHSSRCLPHVGRFSEGIEQLPGTPGKLRTGPSVRETSSFPRLRASYAGCCSAPGSNSCPRHRASSAAAASPIVTTLSGNGLNRAYATHARGHGPSRGARLHRAQRRLLPKGTDMTAADAAHIQHRVLAVIAPVADGSTGRERPLTHLVDGWPRPRRLVVADLVGCCLLWPLGAWVVHAVQSRCTLWRLQWGRRSTVSVPTDCLYPM